jgi:glycine amidinotransferase
MTKENVRSLPTIQLFEKWIPKLNCLFTCWSRVETTTSNTISNVSVRIFPFPPNPPSSRMATATFNPNDPDYLLINRTQRTISSSNYESIQDELPKISSHDEYAPLREVMIGRGEYSYFPDIPLPAAANIVPRYHLHQFRPRNPIPEDIVRKATWELDNFARTMEKMGIRVHRPEKVDWGNVKIDENAPGEHGKGSGYTSSMMRDGLIIIGETVIESAFSWTCRRHEVEMLHGKWLHALSSDKDEKLKIVRAPKTKTVAEDRIFDIEQGARWAINNSRIAFDAADFTKLEKGVVVTHKSNTTNEKGIEWVREHLPKDWRLIIIEPKAGNNSEMHIDATLTPLFPGTAVYNPELVDLEELRRHEPLKTWRLLPAPINQGWAQPPSYMCHNEHLAMNVLVLDHKTVVTEEQDTEMHKLFESLGMKCVKLPFKHVGCLGGSFHCATVDFRRGENESRGRPFAARNMEMDYRRFREEAFALRRQRLMVERHPIRSDRSDHEYSYIR